MKSAKLGTEGANGISAAWSICSEESKEMVDCGLMGRICRRKLDGYFNL